MGQIPRYLLVDSNALPEVYLKVLNAKQLFSSGQAKSTKEAAELAGVSRSAYFKYKDMVFAYNEKAEGTIITLRAMLRDKPGVLSNLISALSNAGANILTINQNIPIRGVAPVSISTRIDRLEMTPEELFLKLQEIDGVKSIENISDHNI